MFGRARSGRESGGAGGEGRVDIVLGGGCVNITLSVKLLRGRESVPKCCAQGGRDGINRKQDLLETGNG